MHEGVTVGRRRELGLIPSARHLPPPQRQAVEVAFGLSEGPSPEPFLIALGILELLGDAAARTPMLIRVEDAQWLDRPTADVLAFVARRLAADPIVLVAALREGYDSPLQQAGLSELHLEPLSGQASEELIELARPGLPPATRARVLAEAEGNPLALRELVDAQTLLPLTRGLEQAFASRAAERAAGMATTTEQRGGLLLQAAAAASELGDGDTVLRLLGEAGGLRLGLVHQAQSMALEDAFRVGPAGDPPRVLELVAMASRVADLGEGISRSPC
ncbi:hypothetical protein [Actinoplanes solisilvae]|uniref:hypothetical protein n=1 Tax=Actinoplanes solisilvae TaxID=2486853 RepID=UPI0013E333C9|nr:hypothetical protein [Actinoplanes solisilvae]